MFDQSPNDMINFQIKILLLPRVPSNSPNFKHIKKRNFQPMNYENQGKQKKKKTKSYRRNVEKFNKVNKTSTCVPEQKPNAEYYNSEVKVVPLSFSENIYSRNHVTDQFFAGSIHRGYQGLDIKIHEAIRL